MGHRHRLQTPASFGLVALAASLAGSLAALGLLGCAATPPPSTRPSAIPRSGIATTTTRPDKASVGIAVLGRSVTEGWFRHWGVVPGRGHSQGRYRLLHRAFDDGPNETAWPEQVVSVLRRYGAHLAALQFKFCFVDFTEQTDLARYQRIVLAIHRAVVERQHKVLLIGNALPNVGGASPPAVIAKQRAFNAWLTAFAAKHRGVHIFDQYSALATEQGVLDPRFAVSPTDAHLNELGYSALDTAYFAFLGQVFLAPRK